LKVYKVVYASSDVIIVMKVFLHATYFLL